MSCSIQELAGHQDLSTTQRYMHVSPAAIEGANRMLDMLLRVGGFLVMLAVLSLLPRG